MDKAEFERIAFYHAYGDLGMIMGLLARNIGLTLGEKGLKVRPGNDHFLIDRTIHALSYPTLQIHRLNSVNHLTRYWNSWAGRWTPGKQGSIPREKYLNGQDQPSSSIPGSLGLTVKVLGKSKQIGKCMPNSCNGLGKRPLLL